MTNLEKIKALCLYPVKEMYYLSVLEDRGIIYDDDYDSTNAVQVKSMQLTRADIYALLLTAPGNITEGGYSLSSADRASLKEMASAIFSKYGEFSMLKRPAVRAMNPW